MTAFTIRRIRHDTLREAFEAALGDREYEDLNWPDASLVDALDAILELAKKL